MSNRKALVVSPTYDGNQFQYLLGGHSLSKHLIVCLEKDGGYQVQHLSGTVTKSDLRQTLLKFFSDDDGAELLFYYYGHGFLQNNLGIFVTSDYSDNDFGVFMFELISAVSTSKAREIVVILDCCHSGASLNPYFDSLRGVVTRTHGRVFLAACQPQQTATEIDDPNYGRLGKLSIVIIDALSGKVENIISGEGSVRGSNLGNYVTEKICDWDQTPVFNISETGNRLCIITKGFKKIEERLRLEKSSQCLTLNVPFKPSTIFEGRDAELDTLIDTILVGGNVAVCATVEGLGGIGKTELILQFIYDQKIQKYFDTIIWIDGSGAIEAQWENVSNLLSIRPTTSDISSIIREIAIFLTSRGKAIIILDNANEWNEISHLFPSNIPLLVTTRTLDFGGNVFKHQELSFLTSEAAKRILLAIEPRLARDNGTALLIQRLEGHALAIELAGLNIKTLDITVEEYLDRLAAYKTDPEKVLSKTKYQRTVDQCLLLTWNRISDASKQLWIYASMFAPVSASRELLRNIFQGSPRVDLEILDIARYEDENLSEQIKEQKIVGTRDFSEIFSELIGYGILSRVEDQSTNEPFWNMHRLVRDFASSKISRFNRLWYLLNISNWLRLKATVSENEIPHVVTAILDSAQYLGSVRTSRGVRTFDSEYISHSQSKRSIQFDPLRLLRYIETELKTPKVVALISNGISNPNSDVQLQAMELLQFADYSDDYVAPLLNNLESDLLEVRKASQAQLRRLIYDNRQNEVINDRLESLIREVNLSAIQLVGKVQNKEFWNPKILNGLYEVIDSNAEEITKAYALLSLFALTANEQLVEKLVSRLRDAEVDDPAILIEVIEIIDDSTYSDLVKQFLRAVSKTESVGVLNALINKYGELKDPDSVGTLLAILQRQGNYDSSLKITVDVISKLADGTNIKTISSAFIKMLTSKTARPEGTKLRGIVEAIANLSIKAAVPALIKILSDLASDNNQLSVAKSVSEALWILCDDDNRLEINSAFIRIAKNRKTYSSSDFGFQELSKLEDESVLTILLEKWNNIIFHDLDNYAELLFKFYNSKTKRKIESVFLKLVRNESYRMGHLTNLLGKLRKIRCYGVIPILLKRLDMTMYSGQEKKDIISFVISFTWNNELTLFKKVIDAAQINLDPRLIQKLKGAPKKDTWIPFILEQPKRKVAEYKVDLLKLLILIQHNYFISIADFNWPSFEEYLFRTMSKNDTSNEVKNCCALILILHFNGHKIDNYLSNEKILLAKSSLLTSAMTTKTFRHSLVTFVSFSQAEFTDHFLDFVISEAKNASSIDELIKLYASFDVNPIHFEQFNPLIEFAASFGIQFEDRFILEGLGDESPHLRAICALISGIKKLRSAFPILLSLLEDEENKVKIAAIQAIRLFGKKEAKKGFQKLLVTTLEDSVQKAVETALS